MAQVPITVNGRRYEVSCGDGEEARLADLAAALDRRVRRLAGQIGQVGEVRLLLLTCLLMEDELGEQATARRAAAPSGDGAAGDGAAAARLGADLEALAGRLEAVVARLDPP